MQTIRAASAAIADDATQLGGFDASQYVRTNDTRFSDDRYPLPNSPNNIQNNPATQQSANFNVNGNGTVGGTLSSNVVNAATQFNIGGNRILSIAGTYNIFAGENAGMARSRSFGYFCFETVEVQRTYTATISSKRYQFNNPSESVVVNFDIENLVFNALP